MDQMPTGKYAPLSPWAYFGLSVLFSVPVVGLVFLIIFSINGSNINRRNYARSFWIPYVIAFILLIVIAVTGVAGSLFTNILSLLGIG